MKLTEEQAQDIFFEDSEEFTTVDQGEFIDEGKRQNAELVFEHEGKNYVLCVARSGSYHTDYYYDYQLDCPEVEKIEVTTSKWVVRT